MVWTNPETWKSGKNSCMAHKKFKRYNFTLILHKRLSERAVNSSDKYPIPICTWIKRKETLKNVQSRSTTTKK